MNTIVTFPAAYLEFKKARLLLSVSPKKKSWAPKDIGTEEKTGKEIIGKD